MRLGSVLASTVLLISGCSLNEVNEVALFDYQRGDHAGTVVLKSVGNVTAGAIALPVIAFFATVAAVAQNGGRISGGVSGGRVTFTGP